MFSSAMGAVFATLGNVIFPEAHLAPGAFALVAMGAVFGAASRAAFTFIIFAFEITRDYQSVLPLMLVTVIADGIAILLSRTSILTEKLARRGLHIHQDYEADVLQQVVVAETMDPEPFSVSADLMVGELANRIAHRDPMAVKHQALPLTDGDGKLVGIVTRGDILRALEKNPEGKMTVLEAGTKNPLVTYPDELLFEAAAKMLRYNIGRLPVVSPENPTQLVGYLGRSGVMAARARRLEEELVREPGWVNRFLP
jgi:CBS domain-containing protein